ncbi:MAG: response regulator [Lentisphaeraceae bacterium]|nr:response regulator [Lentisphaeraceae bacterium]
MHRVLVVDDDINLSTVICEGLSNHGFDVMPAHSGNEALNLLNAGNFEILISDLYMNDGGGQQLISWCRENKPELKVLAISGEALDDIVTALDLVEDHGVATMEKPFSVNHLAEVLKGMMGNSFF